uniref:Uncharacterized protein n=1 Tax=Solibacter usitatus (strain Ellin6076) TaxID=234267 RepID=Q01P80_SOLUE
MVASVLRVLRLAHVGVALLGGQQPAASVVVRVPATSNPYLAGMPAGTKSTYGDKAPEQSPVLVELSLTNAAAVIVTASGAINHLPGCPPTCDPPKGSAIARHQNGAEHGISDVAAPMNSLLGVFLGDDRPDRSRAPRALNFGQIGTQFLSISPQLKQVFFLGSGATRAGIPQRFMVPKGASRLFLGTMDGFEWNNNTGFFSVAVTIERTDVSSGLFSVDSTVYFAKFACMPNRSRCTPEREIVEERGDKQYHIVLPSQSEWGASIANPAEARVIIRAPSGTVCLGPDSCSGPQGTGKPAAADFVAPGKGVGALVSKTTGGRTYFSVNDRSGTAFQKHEGYFEFEVIVR